MATPANSTFRAFVSQASLSFVYISHVSARNKKTLDEMAPIPFFFHVERPNLNYLSTVNLKMEIAVDMFPATDHTGAPPSKKIVFPIVRKNVSPNASVVGRGKSAALSHGDYRRT